MSAEKLAKSNESYLLGQNRKF